MQHQKISSLLNDANYSKFVTRKSNIVNDNSKSNYGDGNEIICNTEVLKCNLYDYNDAYNLVRNDITIAGCSFATEVAFKNCAPFTKCITKIGETTIDNNNFWRSLEMLLINCKVELKSKWAKYCVLSAAGNDNTISAKDLKDQCIGMNIKQKVRIKNDKRIYIFPRIKFCWSQ